MDFPSRHRSLTTRSSGGREASFTSFPITVRGPAERERWAASYFAAMKAIRLTILLLLAMPIGASSVAQSQSKTYSETPKLFLYMQRAHADANLKKLFEEAHARRSDLIQALYDPEKKICINAQVVRLYLTEPEMLAAINEWYEYRKRQRKDYWFPKMELTSEVKYLENDPDLAHLVLKNLYPRQADVQAKLVAYNEDLECRAH